MLTEDSSAGRLQTLVTLVLGVVFCLVLGAVPAHAEADPRESLPDENSDADPRLAGPDLKVDPSVPAPAAGEAESFVIAELGTGAVLAAKNAHQPRLPASTQKILTAVTLLPRLDLQDIHVADRAAAEVIGSRVGIKEDSSYRIADLFEALILRSGNDAAVALAQANGGLDGTVEQMAVEARRLGALNTIPKNPHGLDEPGQSSSAYDLALIAREGMQMRQFRRLVSLPSSRFPGEGTDDPDDRWSFEIGNQNDLLWLPYDGILGIKSGYTTYAGRTFVTAAQRGDRSYLVALMGIRGNVYRTGAQFLDWAFAYGSQAEPVGQLVEPGFAPPPSDGAQLTAPIPVAAAATGPSDGDRRGLGAGFALAVAVVAIVGTAGIWLRQRRSGAAATGSGPGFAVSHEVPLDPSDRPEESPRLVTTPPARR